MSLERESRVPGRPHSTGAAAPAARPRHVFPENFNRSSGPDANACGGCHTTPRLGGGGDNVSNAFVLANARDFAETIDAQTGSERNPPSLFGSGAIDLLGREMTADLQAMKNTAVMAARAARQPISLPLFSKGVSFGWITALPDGSLDASRVEGVDADLVIKPFSLKGVIVSVRQFTVSAFNQHHGMQPSERVGDGVDADQDGMEDEITRGDATATTIFQVSLPIPGRAIVRAFTDLKRHRMGSLLGNEQLVQEGVPTDSFITRKLWGIASEPPFLHNGRATTFTEAILAHGGEAQAARDAFAALNASDRSGLVEFLKSLRILPAGATSLVVDELGRPR